MSELWDVIKAGFAAEPAWAVWIAQFFAIEFKALFNKKDGDTLTEVVRFIFGFSKRSQTQPWGMRGRRASFWLFTAWLIPHFATDWW